MLLETAVDGGGEVMCSRWWVPGMQSEYIQILLAAIFKDEGLKS